MARIVSPIPSVRAEKHSGRGARGQRSMPMLRALTGRSCLNEAPKARSEFCGRTPLASIAGCPAAKRRGHGQWGALLLPSFLVRARKEGRPPGRVPASQPQPSATPIKQETSKIIAAHAQQTSASSQFDQKNRRPLTPPQQSARSPHTRPAARSARQTRCVHARPCRQKPRPAVPSSHWSPGAVQRSRACCSPGSSP